MFFPGESPTRPPECVLAIKRCSIDDPSFERDSDVPGDHFLIFLAIDVCRYSKIRSKMTRKRDATVFSSPLVRRIRYPSTLIFPNDRDGSNDDAAAVENEATSDATCVAIVAVGAVVVGLERRPNFFDN